jgi:hypothetical protein
MQNLQKFFCLICTHTLPLPPQKLCENRNCIRANIKFHRVAEQPLTEKHARTHL